MLAAEARQVADDLARAATLGFDECDFVERGRTQIEIAFEELGGAEDGLKRIVQLVGDTGDQDAHCGEAFLTDHLTLQRLQHLAHPPLLLDLVIEGLVGTAKIAGHGDERVLQFSELETDHRSALRRRQVAAGNALGGLPHAAEGARQLVREGQRQRENGRDGGHHDGNAAAPQRCQALGRHPRRNADAEKPRPALDDRVPVKPRNAVKSGAYLRARHFARRQRFDLGDRADVSLGIEASRQNAAFGISHGDDRMFGQRHRGKDRLEPCEVE